MGYEDVIGKSSSKGILYFLLPPHIYNTFTKIPLSIILKKKRLT